MTTIQSHAIQMAGVASGVLESRSANQDIPYLNIGVADLGTRNPSRAFEIKVCPALFPKSLNTSQPRIWPRASVGSIQPRTPPGRQ